MYRHRSGEGTVCLDDHRDQERVCKALNLLIRQDVLTDWHTIGRRVRGVERRDHWPSWWTFYTSHITDIDNLLASSMHAVIFVHVYTRVSIYIYILFNVAIAMDLISDREMTHLMDRLSHIFFSHLCSSIMLFWTKDKRK